MNVTTFALKEAIQAAMREHGWSIHEGKNGSNGDDS